MRIGILGGTFDPIHLGHTFVARKISEVFDLDRVVFMISKYPPHKDQGEISHAFHRYAMVILGLQYEENFYASDRELRRGGPSYTIKTLEELSRLRPADKFCFIAGSDSLREIHLWKDYDKLFSRHCLVFVQRSGAEVRLNELSIPALQRDLLEQLVPPEITPLVEPGRSFLLDLNSPPVSSTGIRQMIAAGLSPSAEQLSPSVSEYISKYQLYEEQEGTVKESLRGD